MATEGLTVRARGAVLIVLADALLDKVRAAGASGVEESWLYLTMTQHHGCTIEQYEVMVATFIRAGKMLRRGSTLLAANAARKLCPVCRGRYDGWLNCNRPDCHDGRMAPTLEEVS